MTKSSKINDLSQPLAALSYTEVPDFGNRDWNQAPGVISWSQPSSFCAKHPRCFPQPNHIVYCLNLTEHRRHFVPKQHVHHDRIHGAQTLVGKVYGVHQRVQDEGGDEKKMRMFRRRRGKRERGNGGGRGRQRDGVLTLCLVEKHCLAPWHTQEHTQISKSHTHTQMHRAPTFI